MRRWTGGVAVAAAVAALVAACSGSAGGPTAPGGGGNPGPNTPPTIQSITPSSTRVEVGSPVTLTAAVSDAETAVSALTFTWASDAGTFTGTGSTVTWQAPANAATPADYSLTLTVTEHYTSAGQPKTNTASKSITVHVNKSPKELADLSLRFLGNFANSNVPAATCVSEFSTSCPGRADELKDITDNRHDFVILSSTLRPTSVEIGSSQTSATVHTFCSFTSRVITTQPQSGGCLASPNACPFNKVQTVSGDCYTTNVYEAGQWRLCASHFAAQSGSSAFAKAFFGVRAALPE
jgi:hypothetical protein